MTKLTIYEAMAAILTDIDFIGKKRKADMGNAGKYNFRGIDDIYNTLHGSFAKYKVFILPKVLDSKIEIQQREKNYNGTLTRTYTCSAILTIEFTFISEDGSSVSAIGIGQALDQSDKAASKAQSNALKYCLMQAFLIPTEESKDIEDANIEVAPPVKQSDDRTAKAREAVRDCMVELGWSTQQINQWSASIDPLPFNQWPLKSWELALVKAHAEIDKMNQ